MCEKDHWTETNRQRHKLCKHVYVDSCEVSSGAALVRHTHPAVFQIRVPPVEDARQKLSLLLLIVIH